MRKVAIVLVAAIALAGCANMTPDQKAIAEDGGGGAAIGALIGGLFGGFPGAAIGAIAGGVGGSGIGYGCARGVLPDCTVGAPTN